MELTPVFFSFFCWIMDQLAITIGITLSYIFGMYFNWRFLALLGTFQNYLLFFLVKWGSRASRSNTYYALLWGQCVDFWWFFQVAYRRSYWLLDFYLLLKVLAGWYAILYPLLLSCNLCSLYLEQLILLSFCHNVHLYLLCSKRTMQDLLIRTPSDCLITEIWVRTYEYQGFYFGFSSLANMLTKIVHTVQKWRHKICIEC